LGRFISPDTIIPQATNSQAYNRYSYVINNPLSLTDPTGHSLRKKLKRAVQKVAKAVHQFKEQVARSTTHALQKVSSVKYVGGLLSTGYLANPMFGSAYGASTGDWRSVGRATATAGVLAAGVWIAPGLPGLQWYGGYPAYIGASVALGYTSGYALAQINGASSAEASKAGQKGARVAGYVSLLFLGYDAVTENMTPTEKMKAENAVGTRRDIGDTRAQADLSWYEEGSLTSEKLYKTKFVQMVSGPHDWFTGTVGSGLRDPSSWFRSTVTNIPVLGNVAYNVGTMGIAAGWTAGALIAETGTTSAILMMDMDYSPY
jgi:hypothetical protein